MALAKEIMGSPLISDRSSFASSSSTITYFSVMKSTQTRCLAGPFYRRPAGFTLSERKSRGGVVAAVSDGLVKTLRNTVSGIGRAGQREETAVKYDLRAVVTVRNKKKEDLKETLVKQLDSLTEKMGRNIVLELVSSEVDPKTTAPKKSKETVLKDWSTKSSQKAEKVHYSADFTVDSSFGTPGAILVTNNHRNEFFLETIVLEGFPSGPIHFICDSWVQSQNDLPGPRIFFTNEPYLPGETPRGLEALREKELRNKRGDGGGERKLTDRIYDFDVYNDLGNPDNGVDAAHPTLGGKEFPYPRRCRTGRSPCDTDMTVERRVERPNPIYVPRDEKFEEPKEDTVQEGRNKGALHAIIPLLKSTIFSEDFLNFSQIDSLYEEGFLSQLGFDDEYLKTLSFPKALSNIQGTGQGLLKFEPPKILSKDKFAWFRDDEFARQFIAGINPASIERIRKFPPVSDLDPETYGPPESAVTEDHIIGHLEGLSVQQALEDNRLYMLDYHDMYLPFVDGINSQEGRKAYATRTFLFKTSLGTLKPIAIELSLPPKGPNHQAKRVVSPPSDATSTWTWQLARAHVCANDAGVHQLVNHYLRTHACLEVFILAAHRNLSAMHPIFKLLDPHMRYTLEINALARQRLISRFGVIYDGFTPGLYAMQISSAAYKSRWRFDMEGLPADLIRRGMAVPDPTQPHGLKLLLEDYPYANDGLLLWSAIETWVRTYVQHYYPNPRLIRSDYELQSWYAETINVGHADLRDAEWWPELNTPDDLVSLLTTILWLASGQHSALNFAQYPYGGYVPYRPTLMRRLLPEETDPDYQSFLSDPHKYYLTALPSVLQAAKLMAVVRTLSTHSPDEEYLGERPHTDTWTADGEMVNAFKEFSAEIGGIEKEIDRRNSDPNLRNRCGAGTLPYELLAPSSGPGMTCRGVANSVTI